MDHLTEFSIPAYVASTAIIDPSAIIENGVKVDHYTIIGAGAVIRSGAMIGSCTRIEDNCDIGCNTFIGNNVVMRPDTIIGDGCRIGHLTVFEGITTIGWGTLIHSQCHITRGVIIGNKVFIAPMFVGANDPFMAHARRHIFDYKDTPYRIEDGVRVAIGVTVLPGIVLHKNCKIGVGAVVTKDVPENAIVKGVPAKITGEVPPKERL